MYLPVDAAILANSPGSQDAWQQHEEQLGMWKVVKYHTGAQNCVFGCN